MLIWQGILLGLGLSVLAGPMLFILLQAGVEHGLRAGVIAGAGAWLSDIFYIIAVYFGLSYMQAVSNAEGFEFYVAMIGGAILAFMGAGIFIQSAEIPEPGIKISRHSLWWLGTKCFLINTFNPGAALFWIGIMSNFILDGQLHAQNATIFFGSIMGTIVITDVLKVLLAKRIRRFLQPDVIQKIKKVTGLALIIFGILLIFKSLF